MVSSILGFLLAGFGLLALALQRFYSGVPAKELRRLAARGDPLAVRLYRAVAYGASLRLFLWIIVSAGLTGGVLLIAQGLPVVAAFLSIAGLLLIGFVVLQSARLTVRTAGFAAWIAPGLGNLLGWIEPAVGKVTHTVSKRRLIAAHSGMYEKEDLIDLLDQQKNQADNRIGHAELELARRALHFDETQAADVMTVRTRLKTLKSGDAIGPILLDELHDSGQTSFIVYDDSGERVVGVLQLSEAVKAKQGGKVSAIMNKDVVYAHEDFTLRQSLDAILRTGQPMVLVVNGFEELVGTVSLDTLMTELLGDAAGPNENDLPYENRAEIAAYKAPGAEADSSTDTISAETEDTPATAEGAVSNNGSSAETSTSTETSGSSSADASSSTSSSD
jgi:CBS domain containing-hemolysin-like protein